MSLTHAQQTALKADIAADPTLNVLPANSDGYQAIADAYNAAAAPAFWVFDTRVKIDAIYDQITWANLTPSDPVPTDTALNCAIFEARAVYCQGKQFNLQLLLSRPSATFDASKIKERSGLNDATQTLPSGASGALLSGGWANILPVLRRQANRVEKLFAVQTSGVGTDGIPGNLGLTTNPALMVYEGTISAFDVQNAKNQG